MSARSVVITAICAIGAALTLATTSAGAQPTRESWAVSRLGVERGQHAALMSNAPRQERVHGRGRSMLLGGLLGGLAGAAYSGARVGSGDSEARKQVFVPPLIGVALGAAAGALWFEVTRQRR